jgi:DNA modification methylase
MKNETGQWWQLFNGDCVEAMCGLADESIDYSVSSPPFLSMFAYSDAVQDMSNCDTDAQFFDHYAFMVEQLYRVMKPGRLVSFHAMTMPTSKTRDGYIGLKDFCGDLLKVYQSFGFIPHSHVAIFKDPVVQMQRTKALGLLHKQIKKDSAMSRMGLMDQIWTVRKPGDNAEPIEHTAEEFPVSEWQKIAAPCWCDIDQSDVLPPRAAREEDDQKHLAPLQLGVIRRCLRLWSNPMDLVLSPFAGIGSEGYVALQEGRRFVGAELKASYWRQAVANLQAAEQRPGDLFANVVAVPAVESDDGYALPDELDADGHPLPPPAYPQFSGPGEPLPDEMQFRPKAKKAPRKKPLKATPA